MGHLFELHDVHVADGEQQILRGVDLSIDTDGITVVQGPSGSGKSTLLRLLNRLEVATSGSITFRGDDLMSLDPIELRRRVGMVFQRPTPFPGTVRDNLLVADPGLDDATIAAVMDRVGLPVDLVDRDAMVLSGGEAQRMCMARTLATGCEVVLADECTSSLDADATAAIEDTARALAADGDTVVWVTHDDRQAGRLADHRVRIEEGRVVD